MRIIRRLLSFGMASVIATQPVLAERFYFRVLPPEGAPVQPVVHEVDKDAVTAPAAAAGVRNVKYTTSAPTALGFPRAVTWDLANGTLPATLILDPATGVISGKPTAAVNVTLTLRAKSGTFTASATNTIRISVP